MASVGSITVTVKIKPRVYYVEPFAVEENEDIGGGFHNYGTAEKVSVVEQVVTLLKGSQLSAFEVARICSEVRARQAVA